MTYKYEDPVSKGFRKVSISTTAHNSLFKYRKKSWKNSYEYFLSSDTLIIHTYTSNLVKLLNIALAPICIFMYGYYNWKEDFLGLFKERKSGGFVEDHVYRDRNKEQYEDLLKQMEGK